MSLRFAAPAAHAHSFPLTIRHLLDNVLVTAGDQQIVYRDQLSYTYREFPGRIGRLASLLADLGAEQGMTIAVMDWDSHRYLESYFAIPMMGAVLQTVNVRLPASQIAYTLRHAKAEILVVHRDFFPLIDAILPALDGIKAVVAIMDGAPDSLPEWAAGEYEVLAADASPDFPFEDFDENAIATTFYTSGTTGDPKGVCFSHRQLVLHTLAVNAPFGGSDHAPAIGFGDVYMPLTPMFHVHAWGMPYIATMLGVKQVYPGRYEPEMICRLHDEHQVNYSHCVPTILRMVLDAADRKGSDLTGWKMTIGGTTLPRSLYEEAAAKGMRLVSGYGMSETCPALAVARMPCSSGSDAVVDPADYMTVSGVPIPLVSVRVVDDHMNDVPHDGLARGEVVVRAPWLTPCYTGDSAASDALWKDGWLHTQDIGTIDGHGNIVIRDRLKDVIKSGGEWIDSLGLEELIRRVDGVKDVAVVAAPDPHWGERPFAAIVPEPGFTVSEATINIHIDAQIAAAKLSRYAKVRHFALVEVLPMTSVGKVDKKALRASLSNLAPVETGA